MFKDPVTKTTAKFYVCTGVECMISIAADDPMIEKWTDKAWIKKHGMKCELCKNVMRQFFRKDGFLKAQCWDKSHRPWQFMRGNALAMPPLKSDV